MTEDSAGPEIPQPQTPSEKSLVEAIALFVTSLPPQPFTLMERRQMQANARISHMEDVCTYLMLQGGGFGVPLQLPLGDLLGFIDHPIFSWMMDELGKREPIWNVRLGASEAFILERGGLKKLDEVKAAQAADPASYPTDKLYFVGLIAERVVVPVDYQN